MPVYAYKCDSCQYAFRLYHGVDESPGKCARCANDSLKKQFPPSNNIRTDNGETDAKRRVEKYIEETRQAVQEQIQESRKDYIP